MKCPDCGHNNISGADECAECGISLATFDPQGNEVERSISAHSVAVLVPKEPVSVDGGMLVRDVVNQMAKQKIGCVLVLDGGKLAGIFTERDVLNKISSNLSGLGDPVRTHMTRAPLTITKRDSIGYALQAMDLGGYRHLPVVSNKAGEPRGIISVRDILRFVCVKFAQSRD